MGSRALHMCQPELRKEQDEFPWVLFWRSSTKPLEHMHHPMPIVLGINLPRIPRLLVPLLSLWWLAHVGIGLLFSVLVDAGMDQTRNHVHVVFRYLMCQAFGFPFTFACNVYLILAIAAWGPRTSVLETVWRYRLLIDFAIQFLPGLFIVFNLD